jgi:hypothetical protein
MIDRQELPVHRTRMRAGASTAVTITMMLAEERDDPADDASVVTERSTLGAAR